MAAKKRQDYDREGDTEDRLVKLRKQLPHDWEDLDVLDWKMLNAKIVECQTNLVETERERSTDRELLTAKAEYEKRAIPYREAKKRLNGIATYCTLRLEDKGKA